MLIKDRIVVESGWIAHPGNTVLNVYRPPTLKHGDRDKAGPWLDHVMKIYPNDAGHIVRVLAHRVQKPQEKINHALLLGGGQGIGKDSTIEPVRRAVGPWNVQEVSPRVVLESQFTGYLKSVILRISEARDLGDHNRFVFYDHMKTYTAAPPETLRVNEKNIKEYYVFNCCLVIITTNYKMDGIYLPADDRRHYVAWSDLTKDDFDADYWKKLYQYYDSGGDGHVVAYLASLERSRRCRATGRS